MKSKDKHFTDGQRVRYVGAHLNGYGQVGTISQRHKMTNGGLAYVYVTYSVIWDDGTNSLQKGSDLELYENGLQKLRKINNDR